MTNGDNDSEPSVESSITVFVEKIFTDLRRDASQSATENTVRGDGCSGSPWIGIHEICQSRSVNDHSRSENFEPSVVVFATRSPEFEKEELTSL